MPSSSFVLGSGATFVTLLSLVAASPLTYATSPAPAPTENAWDPWTSTTTTSKPVDPATSTWTDWDPATGTKKTTTSKPADPSTTGWANWSDAGNAVTTTKGCGVGYSTYTTKPCWTVDNKQTCTEVVKTTQFDLCSGKPTVPTTTANGDDWSSWAACTPGTTTSVEKSCKQGGPCTGVTKTITTSSCSGTTTTTTTKPNTATVTGGWVDWGNLVTSCSTTASTYTTKPCWTVDSKQTCTEVVKTTSVTGCTTTTKPNTATSTKPATTSWNNNGNAGWNNWNGNGDANKETCGGVVTKTLSSCATPKATSVTSCTTYHLEKAPYTPTSSCTTYAAKESVGPVCATYVAALTYQCGTTQSCSTPDAKVTTTCSTRSVDPATTWSEWSTTTTSKPADPATTWAEWSTTSANGDSKKTTTSAKGSVTSSCTTYHLEKAPYTPVTSCSTYTVSTSKPGVPNPFVTECATVTAKVTPVCNAVPVTSTITSTITNYASGKPDNGNGNSGKPVAPTVQCSTPAVSTVTNCKTVQTYSIPSVTGKPAPSSTCYAKGACSTYHLEVAPYTPTSSCFTTSTCEEVKETPKPGMPNPFATTCETTVVTPSAVCSTVWGDWSNSNGATKTPDAATGTNWASWTAAPSVTGVKAYTGAASSVEAGAFVMVAAAIVGGAALVL